MRLLAGLLVLALSGCGADGDPVRPAGGGAAATVPSNAAAVQPITDRPISTEFTF